jgi:hypothetical protein
VNRNRRVRIWLPLALVVVLALGGTLLGIALTGGGSKSGTSRPPPPVGSPVNGGGRGVAGPAVSGQAAVASTTGARRLTAAAIGRLQQRVADTERAPVHPLALHITNTSVHGFTAPLVRPHVTGNSADVAVAADSTVTDSTSSLSVSAKEPSVAVDGNTIFETGNWYAVRSLDGGRTWKDFDPYTLFGNEFCCDQVVIFDPVHQAFFWLLQFSDSHGHGYLQLAESSASQAFSHYCSYTWTAASFGINTAAGDVDYNDLALTNQFLYIVSNVYPDSNSPGRAAVLRLPLAQLTACGHVNSTYFSDPNVFTLKPVQGAGSVMYFGTNFVRGRTFGATFRIYRWDDSSNNYTWSTRKIDAFNFQTPHTGGQGDGKCGSADGGVANWCERTQGKTQGGVVEGSTLVFSFNAAQIGASRPFPYTRLVSFDARTLKYLGSQDLYSTHVAIQYASLAANSRGDIGGVFAWGGGIGTERYYPGIGTFVFNPSNPTFNVDFYLSGAGNACIYKKDHEYRWGDYLTVRLDYPNTNLWRGTGFLFNGSCGSGGGSGIDHTFVFGRRQDMGAFSR